MTSADVVIVGAGAIGASVAYHLARAGWRDIVVLDRAARPGEGSTGRATGGYRAQFATAVNVRLSLLAREKLRAFHDELGVDPGYRPVGYLWLARTPATLATLRAAQRVQHACGLAEAGELSAAGARELVPALRVDDVAGAVFCPSDGYIVPLDILRGYIAGAERLGVRFHWGVETCGVRFADDREGGAGARRISAVRTTGGEIACGQVVNAAGAWAASLARDAGYALPVAPLRRQVAMTVPTTVLPDDVPMTIVADDGFHFRWREGRVLYAWPTPGDPADPWSTAVEPAWIETTRRAAAERVPVLADVPVDPARCWAGLYEVSPDKLAIVGPAPGLDNLFLVNGCSGHGVMHAPALGQLASELLSCEVPSVDPTELRPERFAGGAVEVREIL
ncbi:MAG TPA: FAD-binding oxidoreductase [Gemmatimonadales bacterium]|nr:FAD-binding oxidoreductase [Gemmatimonadales bacterium]